MKRCPKCGRIVVKDDYCGICNTCVIYEANIIADEDCGSFNKYILFYYLKRLLIPVLCCIIVVIFTVLIGNIKNQLIIAAIAFNIFSVLSGIFEEHMIEWNRKYLTREYARFRIRFISHILSIGSVIMAIAAYMSNPL